MTQFRMINKCGWTRDMPIVGGWKFQVYVCVNVNIGCNKLVQCLRKRHINTVLYLHYRRVYIAKLIWLFGYI